jgi:electron transfer flavoprotein beta subunit
MKIMVCIKQVPAKDSPLRLNENSTWIRESDLSFEINEPDAFALEEALRLKEKHGGEVVVCSVGPARVQQVIREALAKGADRAIHIEDDSGSRLDSTFTARLIAAAARSENFDLICTGLQSDDLGFGQTGVILAELLGLPHATIIMEVQVSDGGLKVKRELEGGWFQWVEMPLPALLTIQSGINKPRYATLMGIKKAKTKEIRRLTPGEMGVDPQEAGSGQKLHRIYVPVKTKKTQFIDGQPHEAAAKLVEKLQRDVRVL